MPCSRTQHGLTRVGLEPLTSGSGVLGIVVLVVPVPGHYLHSTFSEQSSIPTLQAASMVLQSGPAEGSQWNT